MKKIIAIFYILFIVVSLSGCDNSTQNTTYDITCEYKNESLYCSMDLQYVNNTDKKVSELYFNLYPNAFRESAKIKPIYLEYFLDAYPNGLNYGNIIIESVNCDGKSLNYIICGEDENILKVNLDKNVNKKSKYNLNVKFVVKIPNVNHRLGYGENTINLTGFYPILCPYYNGEIYQSVYYPSGDPFYSECADYKLKIKVPSTYIVASSLSAIKTEYFGFETTYHYERENVRDIAILLSEKFNILKTNYKDTTINYYYFNDSDAENSLKVIKDCLEYYSDTFCKYPYNEYTVCEADFIYGGMEYPCLTFIDKNLQGENRDYTIAHETAHQWWYGLVGVNESEEGFLDEGLTEYSTALFMSNSKRYNKTLNDYITISKTAYEEIRDYLVSKNEYKLPIMKRSLKEFSNDLEYVSIAYYRSQIMYNALKEFMGEKKFKSLLKALIINYSYKNVTFNDLKTLAEKKKRGSKSLLEGYVSGKTAI